ncbi:MAG TPA: succinate dehydrogenase, hydrophobic membrane anchor protein [Rhodanobacteraceae bacterium]|nr:succinate dehydrogenase, hydrophobic membrane anchor protein [Rhodanobacteraceae bacterium]
MSLNPNSSPHDMRAPLKRVRALGSAKSGVGHWWIERLTAAALIPISLWFVWLVLRLPHLDFAGAHALVGNPINAGLLILFTAISFWHGALGLQVVIEDYVHTRWVELSLLIAAKFLAVLGAVACALAALKIWLGAY